MPVSPQDWLDIMPFRREVVSVSAGAVELAPRSLDRMAMTVCVNSQGTVYFDTDPALAAGSIQGITLVGRGAIVTLTFDDLGPHLGRRWLLSFTGAGPEQVTIYEYSLTAWQRRREKKPCPSDWARRR